MIWKRERVFRYCKGRTGSKAGAGIAGKMRALSNSARPKRICICSGQDFLFISQHTKQTSPPSRLGKEQLNPIFHLVKSM